MNNFTFVKKCFFFILATMTLGSLQAQMGGLEVVSKTTCTGNTIDVDVKAMNWQLVTSMQFTLGWDSNVLEFAGTSTSDPIFSPIIFGTGSAPDGFVGASWFDGSPTLAGVTLTDVVAFTVSFNVVGDLGDSSPIAFSGAPNTIIEFTLNDNDDIVEFTPVLADGMVSLEVPDVGSIVGENEENGDGTGYLDLIVTGGTAPYDLIWSNGVTTANNSGLSAGDYTCVVTDAFGCSANLGPFTIINDITESTNTIEGLNAFTLTPNPAADFVNLNVDFAQAEATSIKIYALTGKEVYNHSVNAQNFDLQIPLHDFANGAYFLELTTRTGKAVEKLIITE